MHWPASPGDPGPKGKPDRLVAERDPERRDGPAGRREDRLVERNVPRMPRSGREDDPVEVQGTEPIRWCITLHHNRLGSKDPDLLAEGCG